MLPVSVHVSSTMDSPVAFAPTALKALPLPAPFIPQRLPVKLVPRTTPVQLYTSAPPPSSFAMFALKTQSSHDTVPFSWYTAPP